MLVLDLSDNLLSGELPSCWQYLYFLVVLNLANNNLSGNIPCSIGSLYNLQSLHLRNNSFIGELTTCLKNCTKLSAIDVAVNQFSGTIPAWIGDMNLIILSLRSNQFNGSIASTICHLSQIQILDLSLNYISGTIPKCLNNLTAMAQEGSSRIAITYLHFATYEFLGEDRYDDYQFLIWKGREFEYRNTLGLVKSIDVSCNNLTGEIPQEITSLVGLVGLNLSRNNLTGHIDPKIGQLRLLNFLDLSRNQLSGQIPAELSQLSHLGVLDLSNNNLSGRIPTTTQLQTFNASAYMGNPGLCGLPLTNWCPGDKTAQDHPPIIRGSEEADVQQVEGRFITTGFYISMGLGFTLGFWGVFGTALIKDFPRYAYFNFLNMGNWLYLTAAVNMVRLKRWLRC
ncbi:hypothetical protein F0562_001992 [Nyssa sinensis]|uniref:Leucine-rich repeat-containing N-terminal plant-type domain-containing protein n=1 Tax=Nyssa sinensis TaxID=561372 RepID=A0A5J5C4S8_9ASTE|nr:hypothetical protein F0562_001992 [Nyssa sinensis]